MSRRLARAWPLAVWCAAMAAAAPKATGPSPAPAWQQAQRLEALDRHLLSVEQKLSILEDERSEAQRVHARAISRRATLGLELTRAKGRLGHRLGALARREQARQQRWRDGAKSLSAWLDEQRLWWAVAQADRRLWEDVRATKAALDKSVAEQQRAIAVLRQATAERRRLRDALGHERRRRAEALARLAERRGNGGAVVALRHAGAQMLADVAGSGHVNGRPVALAGAWPSLNDMPAAFGDMPPSAAPVLPWPSDGRVRARFGDRVDLAFGTVTRHHGIDIAARAGTRVRAVARGTVVYADWLPGFGQTIIVAHPYAVHSVHAHLQRMHVRVGQGVDAQESLGLVGDTGSHRGSVLYFELRKEGQPQDPLRWLAAR